MAPPLSRSIGGVSSSTAALHLRRTPSSLSSPATATAATTAGFVRLQCSLSSRRGFRRETSSARWGPSGGEYSMERASFTFARLCSCREVSANDCMFSRRYCFFPQGHGVFVRGSSKSVRCSTATSYTGGPPGLDKDDVESAKDRLLVDCGPDQECVTGGIVALGKFDALHLGHRQLAIQASRVGSPFLLSFVGMAEVLGWEHRAPIVAKCDRKRVLSSWAPQCADVVPLEFHVEFSLVRHLSPRQFVERLSKDLRISGVVAGENYRFGYRASGDAAELVRLCEEYGLEAHILGSVLDSKGGGGAAGREPVSSTRVRQALAVGDMTYVAELLGRRHRLVLRVPEGVTAEEGKKISVPRSCVSNQEPREGLYEGCSFMVNGEVVGPCHVVISPTHVHVEPSLGACPSGDCQLIGIDF